MEEHPGGTDHDKEQGKADDELLRGRHTGDVFAIVGITQHHLLAKGEVIGVNDGLLLGRCGTGRSLCGRYLRGTLGLPGLGGIGALLLGAQGFKLSTLLSRTLFLLAACLLGAQSLKLGALVIA